ncbi:hypothetical protein PENTCL1PPCAC_24661, partial [Pristionchus entomophagus]
FIPFQMSTLDECAICYQKMVLPLMLGCNHSFCFLCIKGVHETMNPPLCPMCREDIAPDLFRKPKQHFRIDMKDPEEPSPRKPSASRVKQEPGTDPTTHVQLMRDAQGNMVASTSRTPVTKPDPDEKKSFWLYQSGAASWWRFDPRCEKDLEVKRDAGQRQFDMVICGHSYRIDLDRMVQERLDRLGGMPVGGRNRELLRVESVEELKSLDVRGIAGVRISRD